jgi:hypothetical protein
MCYTLAHQAVPEHNEDPLAKERLMATFYRGEHETGLKHGVPALNTSINLSREMGSSFFIKTRDITNTCTQGAELEYCLLVVR